MSNVHIKIALIISVLLIVCCILIILLNSNATDLSNDVIDKTNEHDFVLKSEQYSRDNTLSSIEEPKSIDKNTKITREAIESVSAVQSIEPAWRITDNCNNPRVGVHVVCTPISTELIQEWQALEEEGEEPAPELFETYTDQNGCFDFPFLEPGRYLIRGDTPNWSPAMGVLDLSTERPIEFAAIMGKEKVICGKVLDCNQKPIQEALVYCYMCPTYPLEQMPLDHAGEYLLFKQEFITDTNGEFAFRGLYQSRNYELYIEHKDCMPFYKAVASHDNDDQVLILKKSCTLEGRIMGYDGKPIVDATVEYCEPQSPYSFNWIDKIDENGCFRSESVPEGFIYLQGMHKDYGHDLVKMNICPEKVNYGELKLPKGVKVRVKITDENDKPIEGIIVTVKAQDTGAWICTSTTDKSGEIIACSLNKGIRTSIFTRDPNHLYAVYYKTHTFNEDSELHIPLNKRIPVKLVVMDESTREVISNYKVCSSSYHKSSALREFYSLNNSTYEYEIKTPSFDFKIAKEEVFELTVLADGYMPSRILARLPSEKIYEVFLKPGLDLNGCVVDADTYNPVSDAYVQFYIQGRYDKKPGFPLSIDRMATSAEDGTFTLHGVPDYRFYLRVEAPGYSPVVIDSLEFDISAPAIDNIVCLRRGGSLSGRIFSQDKLPMDRANIQIRLSGTSELLITSSDPDGNYSLHDLPPGEHVVSVWDVLNKTHSQIIMKLQKTVLIEPGKETVAHFSFEGSCIIRGLCTIDGKEGRGIFINLFNDRGVIIRSVDAADTGYYQLSGLDQGSYTLEARSTLIGAGGIIRKPIILSNGQDLTLDLDFKGKAVYGNISNSMGSPLHAAEVLLLTSSFQRDYLTYTDQEGNYAIFNVEEGDYFIGARAPGCAEEIKGPWMLSSKGKQARKVDFILKPGGTVRIHVKNSKSLPLANAKVLVSNNLNQGVLWSDKTKYSGMAVFDNLQTESLTAIAIYPGYAPTRTIFIAPAGEITDAEVCLIKAGSCKIEVKTVNGLPVSEAQVTLIGYSELGLSPTKLIQLGLMTVSSPTFLTDEKGLFSFGLLPPGEYKVWISKDIRSIESNLTISSDHETDMNIVLQ